MNEHPTMESLDELFSRIEAAATQLQQDLSSARYWNYKNARIMSPQIPAKQWKEVFGAMYGVKEVEEFEKLYQLKKGVKNGK